MSTKKQLVSIVRRKVRDALLAVDRLEKHIDADDREPQGRPPAPEKH